MLVVARNVRDTTYAHFYTTKFLLLDVVPGANCIGGSPVNNKDNVNAIRASIVCAMHKTSHPW